MSFIKAVRMDPDPADRPIPAQVNGTTWAATGYAQAALNAELTNIAYATDGTRNDTLNRAAFNMAQLIAGGQISADQVQDALVSAARAIGLGEREIAGTIRSGFAKGQMRARTPTPATPPVTPLTAPGVAGPSTAVSNPVDDRRAAPVDWPDFWATEHIEEWILEPLIVKGGQTVIYSAPKVGKSLLALELAAGLTTGRPVLGAPTTQIRVLYIDHENRLYGDVQSRLKAMGYGPDHDLSGLTYMSLQSYAPLDTPEGATQLLADVDLYQPELVILDTVSRTISGDENDNSTWLAWYRLFGKELKARDVALLRLDHTGKDESKGQRGGSAKSGDVDLVWNLETVVKGDTYTLRCPGLNRVEITEDLLVLHRRSGPLRHVVDAAGYKGAMDARRAYAIAQLDATGAPKDLGVVAATEWLREHDVPCRNGTLTKEVLQQRALGTI